MPITSGKSVGRQNVAKAGVNLSDTQVSIAANVTLVTPVLDTPGMPKLTWLVTQTPGFAPLTVFPEVAFRRGDVAAPAPAALIFRQVAASVLLVPGVPTVFEFNMPSQAMRMQISTPPGLPVGCNIVVVLMASG
jgi:hypothetical protein